MARQAPGHPPWVAVFNCMLCGRPHPYSEQRWVQAAKGARSYYVVCVGCVPETKKQIAERKKVRK